MGKRDQQPSHRGGAAPASGPELWLCALHRCARLAVVQLPTGHPAADCPRRAAPVTDITTRVLLPSAADLHWLSPQRDTAPINDQVAQTSAGPNKELS
ncbi:hypothetical protein CATMQ487_41750 [Sphaerotilus microaerophilus]|uniref:Uncharacterized protein n=1 Tax=Sphaerotilus microaerophilus TaxID=2914710 RepID=A0ABM7YRK0_9BURK|nr:hypothetical protein CATMQ487_41750 [Sphaerotilus sp. FB-5]